MTKYPHLNGNEAKIYGLGLKILTLMRVTEVDQEPYVHPLLDFLDYVWKSMDEQDIEKYKKMDIQFLSLRTQKDSDND